MYVITISSRGGSFLLECLSMSVFRNHNQTAEFQSWRLLSLCPEVKPWESKAFKRVSVTYTPSTDNAGLLQEQWNRQTDKHIHTNTHTHTHTHLLPWCVEGGRENAVVQQLKTSHSVWCILGF